MMSETKKHLLATTTIALLTIGAAPAAAQIAEPTGPAAATPATEVAEPTSDLGDGFIHASLDDSLEDRLVPFAMDKGQGNTARGNGQIRPFAGGILPNGGMIRSFAGPISGTAGMIRSFYGALEAERGMIRSFAGSIQAHRGMIRSFSEQVNPIAGPDKTFWGALAPQAGSLTASRGMIRSFQGDLESKAGMIRSFYGGLRVNGGMIRSFNEAPAAYTGIRDEIQKLVDSSRTTFGAAVQKETGQTFDAGFAKRMLDKYQIDLNKPSSLVGLNEVGFEMFLLDWYDNIMQYSGQDQVDGWMKQVGWTPALTQNLGSLGRTRIGILDFGITGSDFSTLAGFSGIADANLTGTHGSAVAGLISARHDGRGVMGIAPNAKVFSFNPFDGTGTAGWADVKTGVRYLLNQGASVINMSLGVSGKVLDSGWNDQVFKGDATLQALAKKAVFVIAAGNDGITHNKDAKVNWNFDTNPNIIIVGSIAPDSTTVSAFSNKPGEAQFNKIAGNDPLGSDKLRDRFIVAPGEWMLVSDGAGGVTRMSGTSFAAPLVSGTIALVHDRWPWLAKHPKETVDLILNSAKDIGKSGTDDVFGVGMLDVEASLMPGNFAALKYTRFAGGTAQGKGNVSVSTVLETSQATLNTWMLADDVYFYAFEDLGKPDTAFRDFNIPISAKLIGKTVGSTQDQFDAYLRNGFINYMNTKRRGDDDDDGEDFAFGTPHFSSEIGTIGGLRTQAIAVPRGFRPGLRQTGLPYDTGLALRSADGGFAVRFGTGEGAGFLGQEGFGLQSDYDVLTGGANPFMGLASGSAYGQVQLAIGPRVTVSTGMTQQDEKLDFDRMGMRERQILGGVDGYRAQASNINVAYRASDKLTANFGYTLLNENTALLGMRSLDSSDLAGGSSTDAATFGADYAVANGFSLSASGTMGRTRAGGNGSQAIAVSDGGLISSAWQLAVAKQGVFDGNDRVRVTFAQPLHVEHGSMDLTMAAVIDRETGEIGQITRSSELQGGERTFVTEAVYGRSFMDGVGQFNLFGRANIGGYNQRRAALTLGANMKLGF